MIKPQRGINILKINIIMQSKSSHADFVTDTGTREIAATPRDILRGSKVLLPGQFAYESSDLHGDSPELASSAQQKVRGQSVGRSREAADQTRTWNQYPLSYRGDETLGYIHTMTNR